MSYARSVPKVEEIANLAEKARVMSPVQAMRLVQRGRCLCRGEITLIAGMYTCSRCRINFGTPQGMGAIIRIMRWPHKLSKLDRAAVFGSAKS